MFTALALFVAGFALALLAWPALHPAFAEALLSITRGLVSLRGAGHAIRVESPIAAAADGFLVQNATDAVLLSPAGGTALSIESYANLFVPIAAWLCAALVTPRAWPRRFLLLLLGLPLVLALCWLRLEALAFHERFGPTNGATGVVAGWLVQAFVNPPAMQFAPALIVWLLIGFRLSDWRVSRPIG